MQMPIKVVERRYSPVTLQWETNEYKCLGFIVDEEPYLALIDKHNYRPWVRELKNKYEERTFVYEEE